ncbi:MAG: hypothetical protein RLZZ584_2432 [Pseudomonadota bacterium]
MPKSNTVIKSATKNKGGVDEPVADPVAATPEQQPAPAPVVESTPAPAPAPAEQPVLLTTPATPEAPTDTTTSGEPASSSVDSGTTLDLSGAELPQPGPTPPVIDLPAGTTPPAALPEPVIASTEPPAGDSSANLDLSGGELPQPPAAPAQAADAAPADTTITDSSGSGADSAASTDQPIVDTSGMADYAPDTAATDGSAPDIAADQSASSADGSTGNGAGSSADSGTDYSIPSPVNDAPAIDTPVVDAGLLQTSSDYSASTSNPGAHYGVVADATAAARAVLAADSGIQLVADSARLNAASSAVGLYDGQVADVGIGQGLVLTSGTLGGFTNTISGFGQSNGRNGDDGLNQVVNTVFSTYSYDAAVLEFKFTLAPGVDANSVSFDLVFGSDEFPEWVNSFVDTAAVWVNNTNYALFNHSEYNPLSVVSQNVGAGYFRDNTDAHLSTEYDGISEMLRITAPIVAGENTIRIAIADTGDSILDSAIYLANMKAGISSGSGVTAIDNQGSSGDDSAEGTEKAEYFDLSYGDDSLNAGLGDDLVDGGDGNDDLAGDAGNDAINGGAGDDSARYHGNRADFAVTLLDSGSYQVMDTRPGSPDGTDILDGVEKIHFDDGTYAIETLLDPAAVPDAGTASATTGLAVTDAPAAEPAPADPAVAELPPTDPAQADPAPAEAAGTDGALSGAAADPVQTDPVQTDPAPTDPVAADSGSSTPPAQQDGPVETPVVVDPAPADNVPDQSAIDAAAQAAADAAQAAADAAAQQAAQQAAQAAAEAEAAAQAAAAAETAKLLADLTINGTIGNDNLSGNIGNDTIDGGAGADKMAGGAGDDSYYVDDKKDVVSEAADGGIDTVYASTNATLSANVENLTLIGSGSEDGTGNALDNILIGNGAKNVLIGGAGNDVLQGGGGIDELTGGSGNDYFAFISTTDSLVGAKHDVITDFGQGDMIDLSQIDAIVGTSTDDAFSYIGTDAYTGVAGQLQFDAATGNLSGDVNGDGAADFEINLAGVSTAPSYDSFQF